MNTSSPRSGTCGRLLRWAAAALTTLALMPVQAQQAIAISPPQVIRPPRLVVPNAHIPVRVEQVNMTSDVVGSTAQTRIELVFRNPNAQVLEGELQFPLQPGQTVTGFALDINGELRAAVPVEKAKGQQVFEEVIRRRVDPALLEATQGNNYKLRVYPLPANGTRRVVLNIAETLAYASQPRGKSLTKALALHLPLDFSGTVDAFSVNVRVADTQAERLVVSAPNIPPEALRRKQSEGAALVTLALNNSVVRGTLSVTVPERDHPVVATQNVAGRRYFYAELPFAAWTAPRPAPRKLALLWDASGSASGRNHGREMQVLDAYLKALGTTDVEFIVVRDAVEPARKFSIRGGDWRALRDAIEATPNDGASNLGAARVPEGCELALLFSDGLSNWGEQTLPASRAPLYALSAAPGADTARLRALAEASGGEIIDLVQTSPADAVRALQTQRGRLQALRGLGATELVSSSVYPEQQRLLLAGILTESQATVDVDITTQKGGIETRRITIKPAVTAHAADALAATRWASLKLAQLEPEYTRNQAEIRRIGKTFGLVTRETSLIVLDAVQDYARYEIEPPASLRAAYEQLIATQRTAQTQRQTAQLDRLARRFAEKTQWWNTDFPKGNKPAPKEEAKVQREALAIGGAAPLAPPSPAPTGAVRARAMAPAADVASERVADKAKKADNAGDEVAPASITLKKWEPNAPYFARLRAAPADALYQTYLDERPSYVQSTAFFLDAADIFFERHQTALGLRVLSNLAEMNLENRAILRILAYRLIQAKQIPLAIPVLKRIITLAPNEPQSYRDLGLAYADGEQLQQAADQLWEVVSRPWDGRFPDIDLIALGELNAVIAKAQRAKTPLDTNRFDARLLHNLPLDVRVTLAWDADNTDIDLWVEDPNQESAFFGHPLTYQGGRMSHDNTSGYGPEEFALRTAKPGTYTVRAKFYGNRQQIVAGATTIMMRLSTGFGTAAQKDEFTTLRLQAQGDQILVGKFTVGKP